MVPRVQPVYIKGSHLDIWNDFCVPVTLACSSLKGWPNVEMLWGGYVLLKAS